MRGRIEKESKGSDGRKAEQEESKDYCGCKAEGRKQMRRYSVKVGGRTVFPLCCVLSMLFCLYDTARSHLP